MRVCGGLEDSAHKPNVTSARKQTLECVFYPPHKPPAPSTVLTKLWSHFSASARRAYVACQDAHKTRGMRMGGAVFPARMTRATKNSDPHIALCVKRCLTAVVKTSHCLSKRKQKAENYDPGESSSFSKLSVRRFWGSAHCRALCPCPSSLRLCRAESAPQVRSLRSELESSGSAGQKPQVSAVLVFDAPSPLRKGAVPWDA